MKKPKISVIIPTHNSETYIHRPLDSLINQTFHEIEVIIIDDGSTDKTIQKVRKILSNAPFEWKIIRLKKYGPSIARNIGIKKALGKFVYFLDSDDYIAKNALEELYRCAIKRGADIVLCGVDEVSPNGKILRKYSENWSYLPKPVMSGVEVLRLYLMGDIKITVHSAIYKKELLIKHRIYFPPFWGGEDPDFVRRALFHATKVATIRKSLVYYVKDPKKHTDRNIMIHRMFNSLKATKSSRNYLSLNNAPRDIINLIEYTHYPSEVLALLKSFIFMNTNRLNNEEIIQVKKLTELLTHTKFRARKKVNAETAYYLIVLVLDALNILTCSQPIFALMYRIYKQLRYNKSEK